ncbi:hypothetical protein CR513_55964, partial [Mucuna pruriens]
MTRSFSIPKQKDNDLKREWRSGDESELSSEEAPYEVDLLMVRRLMSTLIGNDQYQRENIFHSSSVNIASLRLVEKLSIPTSPNPKPYKLQ